MLVSSYFVSSGPTPFVKYMTCTVSNNIIVCNNCIIYCLLNGFICITFVPALHNCKRNELVTSMVIHPTCLQEVDSLNLDQEHATHTDVYHNLNFFQTNAKILS